MPDTGKHMRAVKNDTSYAGKGDPAQSKPASRLESIRLSQCIQTSKRQVIRFTFGNVTTVFLLVGVACTVLLLFCFFFEVLLRNVSSCELKLTNQTQDKLNDALTYVACKAR